MGIKDGKGDFDAAVQIARHPVGRGEEILGITIIMKIKEASMFEVAVNNRNHPNPFGYARQPRPQAADTTHDKINLYTRLAGGIQLLNHGRVNQTVDLGNDSGRLALQSVFCFAPNPLNHALSHTGGSDQEMMKRLRTGIAG